MAMDAGEIERLIKARIPDAQVTIRDLAGDGDHYAATVISASFKGKSRVQQHQLVYEALKGQMGGVLHALALQTGDAGRLDLPPIQSPAIERPRKRQNAFVPPLLGWRRNLRYIYRSERPAARPTRARRQKDRNPWASSNSSTMK